MGHFYKFFTLCLNLTHGPQSTVYCLQNLKHICKNHTLQTDCLTAVLVPGVQVHRFLLVCWEIHSLSNSVTEYTDTALSLPSLDRFSASSQGWEARAAVSSVPIEAQILQLSDSEELDVVSVNARDTEDSPPQSRAYEDFVEVVPRAVDWPAEKEDVERIVSSKLISQGPPRNVVALGCPPPPRRVSERSVQKLPVGLPFQDVVLTAQLHIVMRVPSNYQHRPGSEGATPAHPHHRQTGIS